MRHFGQALRLDDLRGTGGILGKATDSLRRWFLERLINVTAELIIEKLPSASGVFNNCDEGCACTADDCQEGDSSHFGVPLDIDTADFDPKGQLPGLLQGKYSFSLMFVATTKFCKGKCQTAKK